MFMARHWTGKACRGQAECATKGCGSTCKRWRGCDDDSPEPDDNRNDWATADVDIVFISALRIETVIGIYDWEKEIRQPVVLDIEMAADVRRAAESDAIGDTLDYKAVSKRLKQLVGDSRFDLVETLAERCAAVIRDEFGVPWVRLVVNKVGAVTDAAGVGVIIERGERVKSH
jgi:dihydroneopterin aldolase